MIYVRLSVSDLGRTRFAYSPLAEVAESLYMVSSGRIQPEHQAWFNDIRGKLHLFDSALLGAVIPARPYIAEFLFDGATDPATTIEQQLQKLAYLPIDAMREELQLVWRDVEMPSILRNLLVDGGPARLAESLWQYWSVAMAPYWRGMRAVLDDDVAHRAVELTKRGVVGLLSELHSEVSVRDDMLQIDKPRWRRHVEQHDLSGRGLLLIPSIFVWPNVIFAVGSEGPPCLTYPARGVGNVWRRLEQSIETDGVDALSSLLGRSRAAILRCLSLPHSTTELAAKLGQSPPSVSQHLSVLRRSGLLISWRSGRSVLYRRTHLASSVVEAGAPLRGSGHSGSDLLSSVRSR